MPFPKPDDKNKLKTWGGGKDVRQARKGQGETNERMEYLIEQVERTNQLLEWLGTDVLRPYVKGAVSLEDVLRPYVKETR